MGSKEVFQIILVAITAFSIWSIGRTLVKGRAKFFGRNLSSHEDPSLFYRAILAQGLFSLLPVGMFAMSVSGANEEPLFRWGFFVFFLGLAGAFWSVVSIAVTHGVIANLLTRRLFDAAAREKHPWHFGLSVLFSVAGGAFSTYLMVAAFLRAIS